MIFHETLNEAQLRIAALAHPFDLFRVGWFRYAAAAATTPLWSTVFPSIVIWLEKGLFFGTRNPKGQ